MHSIPLLSLDPHAPPRTAVRKPILALRREAACEQPDWLAVEEPLEIRVQGPDQDMVRVAVTMRTPGHDSELAVGFLYSEGLIRSGADLLDVSADRPGQIMHPCNVVTVRLAHAFNPAVLQRHFYATSSCGICGKASLEQIAVHCPPVAPGPVVPCSVLVDLPTALRSAQPIFEQTGGLHAAGLFDVTGRLMLLREDVGRHNAVDKLVGQMVLTGAMPLAAQLLLVSGRTSFEIMQKAAMAQVPIVCGVSAPSSLAVEVAQQFGMTLVGFLRQQGCNIYTHPERIGLEGSQRKEGP
jgi:FdhD protein